eukprot:g1108.t1
MDPHDIPPMGGHPTETESSPLESWGLLSSSTTTHQSHYQTSSSIPELLRLEPYSTASAAQGRPLQGHLAAQQQQQSDQLQQLSSLIPRGHLTEPSVIPYPSNFHSASLSVAPVNYQPHQIQEILAHPRFEELVRAIFFGRQIGEDPEKQRLIAEQHKKTMDSIMRARIDVQALQRPTGGGGSNQQDLDTLLRNYLKLVQGLNQELTITQNEANSACAMFEQQIRAITNSATQLEGPVALSSSDEDHLRGALKRKYGDQIKQLSEEFRRKKKKGKLPVNATDVLRNWWDNNLAWPYPSEDEKRTLAVQTNLNATQINNWFINQRKRHWHKFFKDGRLPQSPEEATEILKNQGVIP